MLKELNLYLEVTELVGDSDRTPRRIYLPIDDKIENKKIADIPKYVGMENASMTITYGKNYNANVSSAYLWNVYAGETTVKGYTIFSLMEGIENSISMANTAFITGIDVNESTRHKFRSRYEMAKEKLSLILDQKTLDYVCDKIRSFNSPSEIYGLIDELDILKEKESNKQSLELHYLDEMIENPNGIECRVLDTTSIDFSNAYTGRKSTETLVLRAYQDQKIETKNSQGLIEAVYTANEGEAIFCNNEDDKYVPRDSDGKAWSFDEITKYGYDLTTNIFQVGNNDAVKIRSNKIAKVLPEIITIPTCIKDAWGEGSHQFLFEGATLKQDLETGKVTGIEKAAFDKTWEILPEELNKTREI